MRYVFVSAVELQTIAPDVQAEELSRPPIVLNDIAAKRRHPGPTHTVVDDGKERSI